MSLANDGEFSFQQRKPGVFGLGANIGKSSAVGADFINAVSLGLIPGLSMWIGEGHNGDIDTAAAEDVWDVGGLMQYLTAAETVNIASTSSEDASGNTGAYTVKVEYLDSALDLQDETITLDGVNNVQLAENAIRVLRLTALTGGSNEANVGIITATADTSGYVMCEILAGQGLSHQAHFTVPNGYTALVMGVLFQTHKAAGGGKPVVNFLGKIRPFGGLWLEVFESYIDTDNQNFLFLNQSEVGAPLIQAKTDLRIECSTDVNDTEVTCRFWVLLRKPVQA